MVSTTDCNKRIVAWSTTRPDWERDALRRLSSKDELEESDYEQLLALLKGKHDLDVEGDSPIAEAIAESHLPVEGSQGETVKVVSISDVENAMRLVEGETVPFAESGLTLVYGSNGSGKSGYVRILKRAARVDSNPVLPDVFAEGYESRPPAKANITLSVTKDGETTQPVLEWQEGQVGADLLAKVRVFDRRAASVYISDSREVAFVPFNLDLFEALVKVCGELDTRLENEATSLAVRIRELDAGIPGLGDARAFADKLSASTKSEQIKKATDWKVEEDAKRLKELEQSLSETSKKIVTLQNQAIRVEALRQRMKGLCDSLSAERAKEIARLRLDAIEKAEASTKLSTQAFTDEPLAGVGDGPWRALWNAAREYSTQGAYPGETFPVVDPEDSRCVLCQQLLDSAAKDRLRRFRDFVANKVAQDAATAKEVFEEAKRVLQVLNTDLSDVENALISEIESEQPDLAQAISKFFTSVQQRNAELITAVDSGDFPSSAVSLEPSVKLIGDYRKDLDHRRKQLEAAQTPEEKAELENEYGKLVGRKTLHEHKESIERIVEHKKTVRKIRRAQGSLNTKPITDKKKALEKEYLHDPFEKALKEELTSLGIHQQVTLGFHAEKAVSYQKARFHGTSFDRLQEVLSEGEHQAVGIACFLSETRQGPGNLPIVLDDPVSSLDHERRTRVAKRLLGEAKNRQVIVFTHDVGFYTDVMSLAAELGVPVQPVSLLESAEGFGLVEPNGEPWMMKKVDARLHYLESERLPKIKKAYEAKEATYADDALGFAGRLRETWERLVEEILFNATVIRFRRSVETLRLDAVSVDDNSWKAIYWGIKRTSKWSGHDDPSEAMDSPPSPQDFQEEINHIRECKKEIARVNKEVMKRRKALLLPPKP